MNNFEIINEIKSLKKEIKSNNIIMLFVGICFLISGLLRLLLIFLGTK